MRQSIVLSLLAFLGLGSAAPVLEIRSTCPTPTVNAATVTLIESYEKFSPSPYKDANGDWTVGWGHKCNQAMECKEISYPVPLSDADGQTLLTSDLSVATACINKVIADTAKLTDNQFGAIVSWTFNAGCTNARRSTLIRRLNAGDDPATVISLELPKWNRGDHGVLAGLTARRAQEVALSQIPSAVFTYPCNDPDNDGDPGDPDEGSE